jgi:hypothetical protein
MGQWCLVHGCDFIISTGDNFYNEGVKSADDSRFKTTWRDAYSHPSIANLTWYINVGNHDHRHGRESYQVEHSKIEPRWYFPELTYSFSHSLPSSSTSVKFVSIDTKSIREDKNNASEMIDFLEGELSDHSADWKVVFGHHPCFSAGGHAGSSKIRRRVLPIMKKYNTDVFVSGHDHNQQHWQDGTPDVDHVITGAGGRTLYGYEEENYYKMKRLGVDMKFFNDTFGFAYFVINDKSISWTFVNSDLDVLYEHSRHK